MDRNPHLTLRRISPLLGVLGACAALTAGAHAAAKPCAATQTTVNGHQAFAFCGPATATLTVGGRTYRFHGGQCISNGSTLIANLGVVVRGDSEHNGGRPNFSLTINSKVGGALVAEAGGKSLIDHFALVTTDSGPAGHGTFEGKTPLHDTPFHGSWDCHGAIVST